MKWHWVVPVLASILIVGVASPINEAYAVDTDGDTVEDLDDADILDPFICEDLDADFCDDCSVLGFPDVNDDGPDADSDGICDALPDNCPFDPNPGQEDANSDGVGDVCDADSDSDGDTVVDNADSEPGDPFVCRDTENGVGDSCDDCSSGTDDPFNDGTDTDTDGICNVTDNCLADANFDQADANSDGEGDVCDADSDSDGDTVVDLDDNCPATPNADQTDTNGDGVGDTCSECESDAVCDDGNFCNGAETCQFGLCNTGTPLVQGTECRSSAGSCDIAETCDGTGAACPADVFAAVDTVCNPGSGDLCDPDEVCSGTPGEACPADFFAAVETVCNPSGDVCDPDELCSGVADEACPADFFEPVTTVCNPSGDVCDPDELCAGVAGQACPADTVEPDGTSCADGTVCNGAETCQAGACTAGIAPNCADGNVCTADFCDAALGCDSTNVPDGSLGVVCDTGLLGVCADGVQFCTTGSLSCQQNVESSEEICDGLDNDCDGDVDERDGGGSVCNTPPVVDASLEPICGEDDEGLFKVVFSATDAENNIVSVEAELNGIPVEDGQLVELELDDETETEFDDGVLEIEAPSFTLTVTAIDSEGEFDSAVASPVFSDLVECGDDDEDDDDDDDDDDEDEDD